MRSTASLVAALVAALDQHEEERAERVAALVIQKLGAALPGAEYTSTNLPPDVRTSERFNRIAKTIKGARKDGRVWRVSRDAWEAHRLRRTGAPADHVPAVTTVDTEAYELLVDSGLRSTRLRLVGGK